MARRRKSKRQRTTASPRETAPAVRVAVPTRLPKPCGGQVVRAGLPVLRARYDAAQTTDRSSARCDTPAPWTVRCSRC